MSFLKFAYDDLLVRATEWEQLEAVMIDGIEYLPAAESVQILADLLCGVYARIEVICSSMIFATVITLWAIQLLYELIQRRRSRKSLSGGEINV